MGFKDSRFIGFPIRSWTLEWYVEVFRDGEVMETFGYSMVIAVATTVLSLFIGTWVATFVGPNRFPGKLLVFAILCLPAVVPGVISAIALRIFARAIDLDPGMLAIILGHTVHNVPFVALVVMASSGIGRVSSRQDWGLLSMST